MVGGFDTAVAFGIGRPSCLSLAASIPVVSDVGGACSGRAQAPDPVTIRGRGSRWSWLRPTPLVKRGSSVISLFHFFTS
jgi:hypothetical protein